MSTTISLITIPKEGIELLNKAKVRGDSDEYSSIFFSLKSAFKPGFETFGHRDWIEFKKDAAKLQTFYPSNQFEDKYYFDTNSRFEIIEYLIAKHQNLKIEKNGRIELSFFKGSHECVCLGRNFEFLNHLDLKKKLDFLESINKPDLMHHYEPSTMKKLGIYQMERGQGENDYIEDLLEKLTVFLIESVKIEGYTLILQW